MFPLLFIEILFFNVVKVLNESLKDSVKIAQESWRMKKELNTQMRIV